MLHAPGKLRALVRTDEVWLVMLAGTAGLVAGLCVTAMGLLATLSSEAASSLNKLLGTNAFTTGMPIGGLTVILPQAPSS